MIFLITFLECICFYSQIKLKGKTETKNNTTSVTLATCKDE